MQWKLPGSLCPKKAQQWHIKIKTMLTVFFDLEGIIHHKYAPPGQTINKKHYSMSFIGWEMQYDENSHGYRQLVTGSFITNNMPTHASHLVQSLLAKHQISQVTQPPYSPDLALWDFWLFPKLKSPLKGKRVQTISEIQENTTGQLMAFERTVWGPKVPTLKGTEASLSYVQCSLYLVSSSINVSIFVLHDQISSGQTSYSQKWDCWVKRQIHC